MSTLALVNLGCNSPGDSWKGRGGGGRNESDK